MGAGCWGAVVLAGGRARRLGGIDKPALIVNQRSLLDAVLTACADATVIVVVGPHRPTTLPVRWAREDPPHGGPLAALAAGLAAIPPDIPVTAVLAADLPRLSPSTLHRLRMALSDDADGALLVDATGRPQWLVGVWRTAALRAALAAHGDPGGARLGAVLDRLTAVRLPAVGDEAFDVDTPEDLEADLHSRHTGRPVT